MSKHTILFLAANPPSPDPLTHGSERLDLGPEARDIHRELERSEKRHRFALETRWAVTPLDLLRELRKLKPSIVHFSGHGLTGSLHFESETGMPQAVDTAAIASAFEAVPGAKLVVLNACYSASHSAALLAHVGCVVGMTSAVPDAAARDFSIGFYGALGDGESVHAAFLNGCAAIHLNASAASRQITRDFHAASDTPPNPNLPRLDTRPDVDPIQLIFAADPR